MPYEDQQRELVQPWKQWHAELDPDSLSSEVLQKGTSGGGNGGGGTGGGNMNHGTVAIQPRSDVALNDEKPKPVR